MGAEASSLVYKLKCYLMFPIFSAMGGTTAGFQFIDRYYYYPAWINPRAAIDRARAHVWTEKEMLCCSYPKSGTHMIFLVAVLIGMRGEFPEKADLHTLGYSVEFEGDNSRRMDEAVSDYPTDPRVCISHMPFHHINYTGSSPDGRFVYIMRDPVGALASLRRMQLLLFGPVLSQSLEEFIHHQLYVRETGWLEHVLGWWAAGGNANVLVITYEMLVQQPEAAVRNLARHMRVDLSDAELAKVVAKMDKKWALEHVDPYCFEAKTPFSPPERAGQSKSGFITNVDSFAEKLSKQQEAEVRSEYTKRVKAIMANKEDAAAAANAASFYKAHAEYFD